ncbi:MAG TPA: DUF979 domain-containing protein [Candidatus Mcinerneyibacterium sp.]|nr:DUF979 domain-containing protein [Candidatus Mcinerneyibacterium sp.]
MELTINHVYVLCGIISLVVSYLTFTDENHSNSIGTGVFWGILGIIFVFGGRIPSIFNGILVIIMVLISLSGKVSLSNEYSESSLDFKEKKSKSLKNKIFIPPLIIPTVTFLIAQFTKYDAKVGLGISSIVALITAFIITKEKPKEVGHDARRLFDSISSFAILPQLLAALGALFAAAGVGEVIADLIAGFIPVEMKIWSVIAYTVGMALFTIIMGNAFAAFSVITIGIGVPFVIQMHGANPAIVGVIAMVSGYCGTLLTPMAANFNIVPSALLEMKNENGVITKAQWKVAIPLFITNTILMYVLGF